MGSDLIAYTAAAKLKKTGVSGVTLIDISRITKCSFPERLCFKRWIKPKWRGSVKSAGGYLQKSIFNGEENW